MEYMKWQIIYVHDYFKGGKMNTTIQPKVFNFRRYWTKKVKPILFEKDIQSILHYAMLRIEESRNIECQESGLGDNCWTGYWNKHKIPYKMGGDGYWESRRTPQPHNVDWYRPIHYCWAIAPFCLILGRKIYPELKWKILSSKRHSVAVGFKNNQPYMVFDILNFDCMSAEQILDFANSKIKNKEYENKWEKKG